MEMQHNFYFLCEENVELNKLAQKNITPNEAIF